MITRAVKWVAGKLLRLVPERILGTVLPGGFAFNPDELPPPPTVPEAKTRVLIAPVNYAGQGWLWARAVTEHVADAAAVNMVVRTSEDFAHPAHSVVPLGFYAASRRWQKRQRDAVAANFTHVIVEAEKQPFGALLDESVSGQIRWLHKRGVKVMMLCHGSDIRLPSRHIANNPDSPFLDSLAGVAPVLEKIASRNRRLLDRLGLPVLVSTPDLLLDVPYATWLPVVVDRELWRAGEPPLQRDRPVVTHAPSSSSVKGSELIDPVLRKLEDEGLLSYERVQGVPFAEMPAVYRNADIVIDQLRLGDYGVAACEAMAASRVVVGNVTPRARAIVAERTGFELPIVQSTAADLEVVLRGILADRAGYRAVAERGATFVGAIHDGTRSASVLEKFLA